MKQYTFTLKAQETSTFGIVGDFIHIFSAQGDLTIKTNTGDLIVLPQQTGWHSTNIFTSISIVSETNQTIIFYAGFGKIDDNRTIIIGEVDNSSGDNLYSTHISNITTNSTQLIVGANISRKSLIIQNYSTQNGGAIIVGNNEVSITTGVIIPFLDKLIINNGAKASWYVRGVNNGYGAVNAVEII